MKSFMRRVKAIFKSGINSIISFCKQNKKSIITVIGKIVLFVCKIVIEKIININ